MSRCNSGLGREGVGEFVLSVQRFRVSKILLKASVVVQVNVSLQLSAQALPSLGVSKVAT